MRLLTDAEVARLRARYSNPAYGAARTKLEARAEEALKAGTQVPVTGAGWGHDYYCPEHAVALEYSPDKPREHRCPVDGRVLSGEPFDSAWVYYTQHRLVEGLYASALAWLAGGEDRYLALASEVLLTYADLYPGYEVHGKHAGKGRCMGQSLDEAVWAVSLSWAYDAVSEGLSAEDRGAIEERLLRPAADHLLTQLMHRYHNIECWHLAGLAALGAVLGEDLYIEPAFDPKHGYSAQMREGTMADGWWWEGSPLYHFYTLTAVLELVKALRLTRPSVLEEPRLGKMLAAPLEIMRGDLSVPALNDGWFHVGDPGFLYTHAAKYELAHSFLGSRVYGEVLGRMYGDGAPRDSLESLMFGAYELPKTGHQQAKSVLHDSSGLAVLRTGGSEPENEIWLLMKYGPHGGGHGHPDKLSLDLHAFGHRLSPDLGTPGYGVPLNRTWYQHTLSHNTVLLDETSQPPTEGRLVRFDAGSQTGYLLADALVEWPVDVGEPYAGTTVRRCILLRSQPVPYFLDIVLVDCGSEKERCVDLAWHHRGDLSMEGLVPKDWSGQKEGYAHLSDVRQLHTDGSVWRAEWRMDGCGTVSWGVERSAAAVLAASCPYNPASERMSLLLRRAHASRACFVSVYHPYGERPAIQRVRYLNVESDRPRAPIHLSVEGDHIRDEWRVFSDPSMAPDDRALVEASSST